MEEQLCLHRCCFTGHRPAKLFRMENDIVVELKREILSAIDSGFTTFITGMARGTDIWAAEIILELRDLGLPLKLICASPFDGFESSWDESWKQRYKHIIQSADAVRYISQNYNSSCFQVRNQWMVDHSNRVIAVYNGSAGGTQNTINYAKSKAISVFTING